MGKCNRNLPLLTYSALADFLQRGNVGTVKRRNNEGRMTNDEGRGEYEVVARDVV